MYGKLFLVSTPIGNLEDITFRAVRTLKEVDAIACEDTRNTKKLLSKYGIRKELVSYHEHNEKQRTEELINKIKNGENIALVSDAGTPCISDPGFEIVNEALSQGISVVPVPGATAFVAALSVSGISADKFSFLGFFPRQTKKGSELLDKLKTQNSALIFYESPKRILKTLKLIMEVLPDRRLSVSREITKMYEETLRGTPEEVLHELDNRESVKGEFVFILEGAKESESKEGSDLNEIIDKLKVFYEEGVSLKSSVEIYARIYEMPKNHIYEIALNIWQK